MDGVLLDTHGPFWSGLSVLVTNFFHALDNIFCAGLTNWHPLRGLTEQCTRPFLPHRQWTYNDTIYWTHALYNGNKLIANCKTCNSEWIHIYRHYYDSYKWIERTVAIAVFLFMPAFFLPKLSNCHNVSNLLLNTWSMEMSTIETKWCCVVNLSWCYWTSIRFSKFQPVEI